MMREEVVDLLRREHGCRFVEDEEAGVALEHLDDLDPLLDPDREVLDDRRSGRGRSRTAPRSLAPIARRDGG